MNNKTIKNSITFLAVIFSLASVNQALAYVPGVWDPHPRVASNEPAFYKVPTTYDEPVVAQTSTPTTSSNTNNTKTTTTKKTVTNTKTSDTNVSNSNTELKPVVTEPINNGITALSLKGSGGFMPSSIWQWILVILLILAIILIARKLSRKHENELHAVGAH